MWHNPYHSHYYHRNIPPYAMPSVSYGVTSASTPTSLLTPSTLNNLEQTFIELQSVPVNGGQNPLTQSGFVPPVVDINDRSNDGYDYGDSSDSDWAPSKKSRLSDGGDSHSTGSYVMSGGSRKGGRRRNDENLSAEEEERRRVRRERNKLAAAKCRQRRVDHTNRLVGETDGLEKERDNLELEIQSLQQEKDQLEFILQAHHPVCKVESSEKQAEFSSPSIKIKAEPRENNCGTNSCVTASARPSSLSFKSVKTPGVPITTPSNGFYFSLDNMVDHTGLTPITNGPNTGNTGLTPLTHGPNTCSTEASRTTSESSTENTTSPTLISL